MLDTFGNDGFRGKQDVAMVRCPRKRTGLLIRFTAIIATVLVQGPGCSLIGQRRNENGNSIVGRSQFGNSFPQIMKRWIVRMFKRIVPMFHRVPSSADAGADAWLKRSRRRMNLNTSRFTVRRAEVRDFRVPLIAFILSRSDAAL